MSVTAGICEEVLFRGWLIPRVMGWCGVTGGAGWTFAALAACVMFALGHIYQGPGGALRAGIVGLAFTGLYALSGSLWLPMLLHAMLDLHSGGLGYDLTRRIEAEAHVSEPTAGTAFTRT